MNHLWESISFSCLSLTWASGLMWAAWFPWPCTSWKSSSGISAAVPWNLLGLSSWLICTKIRCPHLWGVWSYDLLYVYIWSVYIWSIDLVGLEHEWLYMDEDIHPKKSTYYVNGLTHIFPRAFSTDQWMPFYEGTWWRNIWNKANLTKRRWARYHNRLFQFDQSHPSHVTWASF